ncbi:protein kinase [Histoplasma capsulatum H143]|uniref:non-specific serine/threonine protein kinase n=1 Tax=Ajellomyces capsulatus (strain H143) TaxID=544712 RepID=C6HPL6_AJECH|nr:protein kinase [Histoplasma capsulatum H143]
MSSVPPKRLAPLSFPTSGFKVIDRSKLFQEETLPGYKAELYYPVPIGEVFNKRYQVMGKLGFGVTSTVCLARDLVNGLKTMSVMLIPLSTREPDDPGGNEIAIYERIKAAAAKQNHLGHETIRKCLSSFEIQGKKHTCIVHEALGMTMEHILLNYVPDRAFRIEEIKMFILEVLIGLDFLHTEARIIHTDSGINVCIIEDLQLKNLLIPVGNPYFFEEFVEGECNDPAERKILKDRIIYNTRHFSQDLKGLPRICDFGEARFADGDFELNDDIMPDVYRAPEVVMRMAWNNKVDIWSVAMVAWDLLAKRTLFHRQNPETEEPDDRYLLAERTAVLGPRLLNFNLLTDLDPSALGKWKDTVPITDLTLEKLAAGIKGKDKVGFLHFLRRILRWLPEDRPTTEELVNDPWLGVGPNIHGTPPDTDSR